MSAAIDELIAHRAMMLSRREALVAELKTLDTDMAAVTHVVSLLDPARAASLKVTSKHDNRPRDRPHKMEPEVAFAPGEMAQGMLEVLRDAKALMDVGSVTRAMLTAKGVDPQTVLLARLSRRLSTNMQKLFERGRLKKHFSPDGIRWEIDR